MTARDSESDAVASRRLSNESARVPMLSQDGASNVTAEEAPQEPAVTTRPASLRSLFRYASKSDMRILWIATFGAVIQGFSGPALAFFMQDLFQSVYTLNDDRTIPPTKGPHETRDQEVLKQFCIFCGLAVVAFVSSGVSYLGFARVGDNMTMRLKRDFFAHLLGKDVGWYDSHSSAEMATRLTNDTYDFRQGTGEKLAQMIMGLVMSPAGFVVAFYHDWRLTLMMFVAIPIMAFSFGNAMKTMTKSAAQQQEAYSKAGGQAETSISSIRTVAAFGGYQREADKYDESLAAAERSGVRAGWCNGFSMGFSQLAIYGTFALGFWAGSVLVINDYNNDCWVSKPPYGHCFTGFTMLATLFAVLYGGIGLGQVVPSMAVVTAARAAAGRIYAVLDEPPAFDAEQGERPEPVADGPEGKVEFREVSFSYPSRPGQLALSAASFELAPGRTAAFVGPSGSGKSTVIALLQRFYDVQSGQILVDGHDIRALSLSWLRAKMALVQQEPVLFSGSIFDNIGYGSTAVVSQADVEASAAAANAHGFIMDFPNKYHTEVGERGTQLSGGQKQRIAIARAMIRNPAILLLDEATSALDSESERVVQQALDKLLAARARTTLVVAHRLSTIRNANQIFVLEDGLLKEQGTHEELMATSGSLYAQLVELQEITEEGTGAGDAGVQRQASGGSDGGAGLRVRQLSRESSGGRGELRRQSSRESRGRAEGNEKAEQLEAPPEDDKDVDVPRSRLWKLQREDAWFILLALACTIPVGAGRPFMGKLFAKSNKIFSQQPAVQRPDGTWVGVLDTEQIKHDSAEQCLLFALTGVILFLATWGQIGGFRRLAEGLTRRLRIQTFKAMLRQEISWFDARTTGHLANRLASETPLIKSYTGESLAAVMQLVFCLGTGIVMALEASWQLTLSSLIFVPVLALGTQALMKAMKKINETTAGPMVSEAMQHIRTVASFGLKDKMMERYVTLLSTEAKEDRRKSTATGFASAYNAAVTFVMFGGVIFMANQFVDQGWMEPDNVLSVLFPIMFAASGAAIASQWQADKAKARLALNHIFGTIDRVPDIDAYSVSGLRLEKVAGEIEFQHVAFRYPTRPDVMVFEDFDLKIDAGTTVAFCGPSGSGKSTTISLLQRFYRPLSGCVCLDGHDISTLNLTWLREQMALVQQEPVLFAGTLMENIRYGRPDATDAECKEAAKAANADSFIMHFEATYDTQVGERGAQLSGGQKQRVAIARSMVRDPPVLLLDEATSALDTESERVVQDALDALLKSAQRTTLVIAHRLSTIINSDMICVIYQGKIVEKGTHAELMKMPNGHYTQLAARQQGS